MMKNLRTPSIFIKADLTESKKTSKVKQMLSHRRRRPGGPTENWSNNIHLLDRIMWNRNEKEFSTPKKGPALADKAQ